MAFASRKFITGNLPLAEQGNRIADQATNSEKTEGKSWDRVKFWGKRRESHPRRVGLTPGRIRRVRLTPGRIRRVRHTPGRIRRVRPTPGRIRRVRLTPGRIN